MKISIIVVSLNAGEALQKTITSILNQTTDDFEVIIKDGGSTDGSLENLPQDDKIRLYIEKDTGVYDAMNQAAEYAVGDYLLFLNCGDTFFADCVLQDVINYIGKYSKKEIFYGDCYTVNRNAIVHYPDEFDSYVCFSKTLCHQATVFPRCLFQSRKYQLKYKICADMEYYINAFCAGYKFIHIPFVVANYEGGGVSETYANRKRAIKEKKEILKEYFKGKEYLKNIGRFWLHGGGIKQWLASSKYLYGIYSRMAGLIYSKKRSER